MNPAYADIALDLPFVDTLQYALPESLQAQAEIGKRVWVTVRNRKAVGYIVGFSEKISNADVRNIDSIIDPLTIVSPAMLELARWMADYYCCTLGQAMHAAMPAVFKKGKFEIKVRAGKEFRVMNSGPSDWNTLTETQNLAFEEIMKRIGSESYGSYLLHGVTGSGKTEIYMHLIRELMKQGKGSIVLVPEIALTPQTVDRFVSRFGQDVAVIHSHMSEGRRLEAWHQLRSGALKVVVGARSAIFSPVKNLGLIVIDEEHDTSYKQEETPRYQTRQVADKRAQVENAVLVLGSATPSLESFYAAQKGEIEKLSLPVRIENRPLPEVEIVDMRRLPRLKDREAYSYRLEEAVKNCLQKKEQVMLLLNRRGYSTYLHCASCGHVVMCERCKISLVYHTDKSALFCHACHFKAIPQRLCPSCKKNYLHYFGLGTQKVEAETRRLFPGARIGRMDSDTTTKKGSHEKILEAFKRRETDILIGTQMIAKGHDYPNVSLIGVISADMALYVPDFRSGEKTFNLLTQVAGRAGRGDLLGRVIIQTNVPTHYTIQSAKNHDYQEFYNKEIQFRGELGMPPFSHLARLMISGLSEKTVMKQSLLAAQWMESKISSSSGLGFAGPAPALHARQRGRYQWNIILKSPEAGKLQEIIKDFFSNFKKSGVRFVTDVDPQ